MERPTDLRRSSGRAGRRSGGGKDRDRWVGGCVGVEEDWKSERRTLYCTRRGMRARSATCGNSNVLLFHCSHSVYFLYFLFYCYDDDSVTFACHRRQPPQPQSTIIILRTIYIPTCINLLVSRRFYIFFFEMFSHRFLHFASSEYIHATLRVRTPAMVSITVRIVGSILISFYEC